MTSLRQVTEPAFIKASLSWHHKRAGKVNDDLAQLGATIASIAKYLDVPPDRWAAIKPLIRPREATAAGGADGSERELLQALDDPIVGPS